VIFATKESLAYMVEILLVNMELEKMEEKNDPEVEIWAIIKRNEVSMQERHLFERREDRVSMYLNGLQGNISKRLESLNKEMKYVHRRTSVLHKLQRDIHSLQQRSPLLPRIRINVNSNEEIGVAEAMIALHTWGGRGQFFCPRPLFFLFEK